MQKEFALQWYPDQHGNLAALDRMQNAATGELLA